MGHQAQVENDGRGNDGHDSCAHLETEAPLLKVAHDAGRGVESERAASAQEYGVHLLDEVAGAHEVGLASAGGGAANVHAGDGALGAEHDCTAGGGLTVGEVPYTDAGYVSYGVLHGARSTIKTAFSHLGEGMSSFSR